MPDYKIFICGNFGYKNNKLDGQTVKTRVMKEEFVKRIGGDHIIFTDTSYIKSRPFFILNQIRNNFKKSNYVVMMPDKKAFKVLLPFYIKCNKHKNKDIRYVVIGGWLPGFLCRNKFYAKLVSRLSGVYVESVAMKKKMNELGLTNVYLMPNFRSFEFKHVNYQEVVLPLKLVYFSRVLKEKGIELAIEAVEKINNEVQKHLVSLDIYGPIEAAYKEKFENIIVNSSKYIAYKRILQPEEIHKALSAYDLMVLPTCFSCEGLPGAIIDSYIAGVPVLASEGLYYREYIIDNVTGKMCKQEDLADLVSKIRFFIENKEIIASMKESCQKEAQKYHADNLIPKLIEDMKLDIAKTLNV